ncbi:MAG: HAD family phosphatase [Ginsengibacter sp.]
MPQIKNIIFDLGGVLLDIDYHLTQKAFEDLGVKDFDSMYSQASADQLFQLLETGRIKEAQFYAQLKKCSGLNLTEKQIDKAWNSLILDFREESLIFLSEIGKRYRIFLFSNTNVIHMEKFQEIYLEKPRPQPFNELFEKAFYSCEIGLRKPDITSYQFILDHANIKPQETCFIDDSIQNVEAAKLAGMKSILLKKDEKIENLYWE